MQVRHALMSTAVPLIGAYPSFDVPNNFYGYGLIDAYDAVLSSGPVFSNIPIITVKDSSYFVTTWIASKTSLVTDSLALYYRYPSDTLYKFVALVPGANPHEYNAIIPMPPAGVIPVCYFSAKDAFGTRTSPFDAPDSLFSVRPTSDSLQQFYPTVDSVLLPNYIPTDYTLAQNYPNPFNATTTIQFYTPTSSNVQLAVFNLLGQRVKFLFQGASVAGWNTVRWNEAKDDYGHSLTSGVYFARFKAPGSVLTLKMLYVK